MASSLGDMVTAIAPTIPPALISPAAVKAIEAIARPFPLPLGTTIGFERPLHTAIADADFFMRVSGGWGKSLLAGQPQAPPVLDQLQAGPTEPSPEFEALWQQSVWRRIRQMAHFWDQPTSLLHAVIEDIWLEFDVDPAAANPPLPSSFFGITPAGASSLDWVRQIALPILLGDRLPPHTDAVLHTCFESIAAPASLFQVGLLTGRAPTSTGKPAIRLYIQNLSMARLQSTLRRLAWSGDLDLLAQTVARACGRADRFSLQLEVGDTLSPTIAVECHLRDRDQWQQVLSRLVATGFCVPDVAAALLAYPGYVRAQDTVAPFPELLSRWSSQLSPYRECVLMKRLSYLKFTHQPGQPLLAKAYLGLSPIWLDSRYLTPDATEWEGSSAPEATAVQLCKALIRQLDYGEIDVDALFSHQRSQKARWLQQAIAAMCIGS